MAEGGKKNVKDKNIFQQSTRHKDRYQQHTKAEKERAVVRQTDMRKEMKNGRREQIKAHDKRPGIDASRGKAMNEKSHRKTCSNP